MKNTALAISGYLGPWRGATTGRRATSIFFVEFDKERNLFDLIGFRLDLGDLLGAEVDAVTPHNLRYLRDRVLAEAKPL